MDSCERRYDKEADNNKTPTDQPTVAMQVMTDHDIGSVVVTKDGKSVGARGCVGPYEDNIETENNLHYGYFALRRFDELKSHTLARPFIRNLN